ncbi:transglutaminase domain-containing protein [bacterium]|nr:transglutaminase domain-containing protein [bacterium]
MVKGVRFRELASALVWACATCVATFFVSLPSAALIAALGGFVGYLVGCALAATPLRMPAALAGGLLAYLMTTLAAGLFCDNYAAASALGAANAFTASQWFNWGGKALCATAMLRFLSGRQPFLISAEILSVTLLLASPLASHRQGFINRPYFLVDPLWSQNLDPIPVLFALGAVAAALLVILQNGRRTRRASWFDMLLLFVIIGLLYAVVPDRKLLDFDIHDPFGVKGKNKQGEGGKGKPKDGKPDKKDEEQGGGRSEAEEMPLEKPQEDKSKPEPVAVVLLRDDYDPPYGYYYFRQTAFSQYNGKRLVADTTGKTDQDMLPGFPTQPISIQSTVPLNSPYHRQLGTKVAMIKGHTKPFSLVDGRTAEPANNPNPSQFVRAYECKSLVLSCRFDQLFPLKSGDPSWDEKTWKHYTALPDNPKYKELAERCAAQLPPQYQQSDFARAVAVKLYMDQTMTYTMRASHEGYPDPVAHYLFEDQRGYCVHQAHAAVYLFRSLGVPSRVGAGYATDARNRGNGTAILLRSGEAHAWPEVYLQGAGWVILDISPEKHEGGDMDQPDPNLQRMLGELARDQKGPPEDAEKFKKRSLQQLFRAFLLAAWSILKWGFLAAFVANYLYKFFRRFEPLWCSSQRLPVAALRSGQDQLAEVGALRSFGEDRMVFARRLGLEALEPLTYWHLAATMGGKTPPAKELLQLRERLHQQIARRYSLWRRLLGFINPLSWWSSK